MPLSVSFSTSTNESLLEHLPAERPLLKVVEYKRRRTQVRRVESIIRAIRRGRVYPLFSQTADGRVVSTAPDLFTDDGLDGLCDCIRGRAAVWLQNRRRSLDLAQEASGDLALKEDREGTTRINRCYSESCVLRWVCRKNQAASPR